MDLDGAGKGSDPRPVDPVKYRTGYVSERESPLASVVG